MNYRHSYHAGNFADVFKHSLLVTLIESMQRKENGFCYLDTHAGTGLYDLSSKEAQKGKEHVAGIDRLLQIKTLPPSLQRYISCVKDLNPNPASKLYPGSPLIAKNLLRPQDRLVLSELHPNVYQQLKRQFARHKQISMHYLDGYQSLKAFLPPKERRGLILIDPPYEKADEFLHLTIVLQATLKRFDTGVYAIWYPIKERQAIDRFHHTLKQVIPRPMLVAELCLYPDTSAQHLNGCGMVIINPPWQLDEQIKDYLPRLWSILSPHGAGASHLFTLT